MKVLHVATFILLAWSPVVSATESGDYINASNCDQVLDKGYYRICYDYSYKGAKFVAYTLDGKNMNASDIRKRPKFYADRDIPEQFRTSSSDYTKNEFMADRGHLAPDASFDYSRAALNSVYSMANIIPQYAQINRKTWVKAERYERQIATKLGRVSVINGVIYAANPRRMGSSGIAYPDAYWKMVYDDKGFERCFYYRNDSREKIRGDKLRDHRVSCKILL